MVQAQLILQTPQITTLSVINKLTEIAICDNLKEIIISGICYDLIHAIQELCTYSECYKWSLKNVFIKGENIVYID